VWNYLYDRNKITNFVAACFLAILFENFFEVDLLQNEMNFTYLIWFIITLGLRRAAVNTNSEAEKLHYLAPDSIKGGNDIVKHNNSSL
jgi:hypothetical protein